MKTALLPYLLFMGKTGDAMKFYHSIFGGTLKMQTFKESGMPTTPENENNVIHAELATPDFTFMASDGDAEHPVHMGDNIAMSLVGTDEKQLTDYFHKLADGGTVKMQLQKQFWGDVYGQVVDRFGIEWMVNIGTAGMEQMEDKK